MIVADFALIVLATWYAQHLAAVESGPWGVFDWIRERVFGVEIQGGPLEGYRPVIRRPGVLADLVTCIYCRSFWVFGLMAGLWLVWHPAVLPFAGAGAVALLDKVVRHGAG